MRGFDCKEFPDFLRFWGIKHHLQSLAFPLAQDGTLGAKANVATVSSAIDTCERRGSAVCFPWCHNCNMSDL